MLALTPHNEDLIAMQTVNGNNILTIDRTGLLCEWDCSMADSQPPILKEKQQLPGSSSKIAGYNWADLSATGQFVLLGGQSHASLVDRLAARVVSSHGAPMRNFRCGALSPDGGRALLATDDPYDHGFAFWSRGENWKVCEGSGYPTSAKFVSQNDVLLLGSESCLLFTFLAKSPPANVENSAHQLWPERIPQVSVRNMSFEPDRIPIPQTLSRYVEDVEQRQIKGSRGEHPNNETILGVSPRIAISDAGSKYSHGGHSFGIWDLRSLSFSRCSILQESSYSQRRGSRSWIEGCQHVAEHPKSAEPVCAGAISECGRIAVFVVGLGLVVANLTPFQVIDYLHLTRGLFDEVSPFDVRVLLTDQGHVVFAHRRRSWIAVEPQPGARRKQSKSETPLRKECGPVELQVVTLNAFKNYKHFFWRLFRARKFYLPA